MKKTKNILYLGLDPSRFFYEGDLVHFPLIEIVPRDVSFAFDQSEQWTHVLFTSRSAIPIFFKYARRTDFKYFVVGEATAEKLKEFGQRADAIAPDACGEGVIELLQKQAWEDTHLFFPHSSSSRSLITDFLKQAGITHTAVPFYDTLPTKAPFEHEIETFDQFVFTSPSTVEAYLKRFKSLPAKEKCVTIGPITKKKLLEHF